jgi:UDP-N-acetyl-D-mannosaminuronic acid dehydrogenase
LWHNREAEKVIYWLRILARFIIKHKLPNYLEESGVEFEKICVLGLGYIGLPTASTFANHGIRVIGVDVNPEVVETLRKGGLHIHEPGLHTLVQAALGSGNLVIGQQPEPADAFIIAVPTPFYDDKRADLRYMVAAAQAIVPCLQPGNLVVLESTSPPLTTQNTLTPILERSGLKAGTDFHLAYSPERVLPGQILRELIENARVIGGVVRASALAGAELILLLVGHAQFRALEPAELAQLTPVRRVLDAINGWPGKEWQVAGFEITRLGASTAKSLV